MKKTTSVALTIRLALAAGCGTAGSAALAAKSGCGVCAMHMQGGPQTMQINPQYGDVVEEVRAWLAARRDALVAAGIALDRIALDPGIGFGKDAKGNLDLIRRLREFRSYGRPILIGASRKGFIGKIAGGEPDERLTGSLVAATAAIMNGANLVRAHDVLETVKMARLADAIRSPNYKG